MSAEIKNLAHDVKHPTASLQAYATTRDLKNVEDRIAKMEANQTWLVRSVVSALLGVVIIAAKGGHL
jgi:hypothetical protein